jgi:hypothetical protein
MAFNAQVVLVEGAFDESKGVALAQTLSLCLSRFKLRIEKIVDEKEYTSNNLSKEINRYLRTKKGELVKIGTTRYNTEQFASVRYGFISMSTFVDKAQKVWTALWFNYNAKLNSVLPRLTDLPFMYAELLSRSGKEALVLATTSLSRQEDMFAIYIDGVLRNTISGKTALTEVKNLYAVDINHVMDNIDMNIAIFYAPHDFAAAAKELDIYTRHYNRIVKDAEEIMVSDKQTGENMMKKFEEENNAFRLHITQRYAQMAELMKHPAIGTLIFVKLDWIPSYQPDENVFGRINEPPRA